MNRRRFKAPSAGRYGKRHTPGEMNQTEALYAAELQAKLMAGEILGYWFEPTSLRLADGCRYIPDFMVLLADFSIEFVDTKGAGPLAAEGQVKLKVAADLYWPFRFVQLKRRAKKDGGGWTRREF